MSQEAIKPLVWISLIGILCGLLATGFAACQKWLPEADLKMLFATLRGPISPPEQVVVVPIDNASARVLAMGNQPQAFWDRRLHARLVDKLSALGASVIVLDINFIGDRPDQDPALAAAMQRAGNVVLYGDVKNYNESGLSNTSCFGTGPTVSIAEIPDFSLMPETLRQQAAGIGISALPLSRGRLYQYAVMHPRWQWPLLSAVAFQQYALSQFERDNPESAALISQWIESDKSPTNLPADTTLKYLRDNIADTNFETHLKALTKAEENHELMDALINLYQRDNSQLINHYGPAGTINIVSYSDILLSDNMPPNAFRDKAVFIGFSDQHPGQIDAIATPFLGEDEVNPSGVEIVATIFANILDKSAITLLSFPLQLALLLIWPIILTLIFLYSNVKVFPVIVVALITAHLIGAELLFSRLNLAIPVNVPLLVQLPFTLLLTLIYRNIVSNREKTHLRQALVGYLPDGIINELMQGMDFSMEHKRVFAVCMASDMAGYTRFSEKRDPDEMRDYLNKYFHNIIPVVRRNGGYVSDIIGDGTMSVWATTSQDPHQHQRLCQAACNAALTIQHNLAQFSAAHPEIPQTTRIGLHCGALCAGTLGADDHFEYRFIGETIVTASRLEQLNKQLNSRILVSKALFEHDVELPRSDRGEHRLRGQEQLVHVYELLC